MKQLIHLMGCELKNIIRGKFHIVLFITFAAVVGVYYLLPRNVTSVPEFESSDNVSVTILESDEMTSLRILYLPVMLSFEVAILGFLFIAVTIFNEKEEGIVLAYRISPSGTLVYTASKILVWTLISTLYGIALLLSTRITGFDYLSAFGMVFISSFFMTSLGMFIAIFFKNLSDWFFPGVIILVANMVPQTGLADQGPGFFWIKLIPGYWMSQGFGFILQQREVSRVVFILIALGIASLLMLCLTVFAAHLRLMKEGN